MPQLDKFIFLNQILGLIFFFFLIYIYVRSNILPKINAILKYRNKKRKTLINQEKGSYRLYSNANLYFSKWAVNYINYSLKIIQNIFNECKNNSSNYVNSSKTNMIKKKLPLQTNKITNLILQQYDLNPLQYFFIKNTVEEKRTKFIRN